jgi:hypothetical protein
MAIELGRAAAIAQSLPGLADDRPDWLRALRDACHPDCLYYRFLYELAKQFAPIDCIEVGTFVGTSAAHLAAANRGYVVTLDIQPDAKVRADAIGLSNLYARTAEAKQWASDTKATIGQDRTMFDVAYIDGLHNFSQTYAEYTLYRRLVRDGGLMIFDDVGLVMDGDEMEVFWALVQEPKVRLDYLHSTGFGIVQKQGIAVPDPAEVDELASTMINARRA